MVEIGDKLFVVKVNIDKIRAEKYYDKRDFPEYITAIDFENESYMAFVLTEFIETRSMYTVVFENKVFRLQKDHKKTRWDKEDGVYSFTLCTTALDTWKALKGYVYQLITARKTLLRKILKSDGAGEWIVQDKKKEKENQ